MSDTEKNVWGSSLVDYLKELRSQSGVSFSFTGDAIILASNRVEPDPDTKDPWGLPVAKTFYVPHPWDLELSKYPLKVVADMMVSAGGELRKLEPQGAATASRTRSRDVMCRTPHSCPPPVPPIHRSRSLQTLSEFARKCKKQADRPQQR